jgi:endonuclease/exonuclease/phosphatase family metal-dependent hydrolase
MEKGFIRLVTWNIEKGKRWKLMEQCLSHESIRTADILCLNEVDEGMARSGNLRIGHEMGERLGMQVIFGQTFKEFTKGYGDDELLAPGENTTAIQGNAILTRLPIVDTKNLLLPACYDHSKRVERRAGNRHALIARLDCGARGVLTIANAHLEVFGTSRCRGVQMKFLLDQLPPGSAVVTGDFNTNTFSRGNVLHLIYSLGVISFADAPARVRSPWPHEPLFKHLAAAGFSWDAFNDAAATCPVDLHSLEERADLPAFVRKFVLSRCSSLPFRLDFICGRAVRAVSPGRTITDLPCQPSDHLPITCDLMF